MSSVLSCWNSITHLPSRHGETVFWLMLSACLLVANKPVYEQPSPEFQRIAYDSQYTVLKLSCWSCQSLEMKLGMFSLWPGITTLSPLCLPTIRHKYEMRAWGKKQTLLSKHKEELWSKLPILSITTKGPFESIKGDHMPITAMYAASLYTFWTQSLIQPPSALQNPI